MLQEKDDRWIIQGDPTEGALIVAARKAGLTDDQLTVRFARIGEVPFSSERKLMSTVHTDAERPERLLIFIKGAPDVLLTCCQHEWLGDAARPLTTERRQAIRILNEELASEALRTLGVGFRSLPSDGLQPTEQVMRWNMNWSFWGWWECSPPPDRGEGSSKSSKRGWHPLDHDYGRSP